jgi:CO dehydrogenase/acetyl-CoA synthase alpha subunit
MPRKITRRRVRRPPKQQPEGPQACTEADLEPDWTGKCEVCGASPTVPTTGMCGPCTFGEADTAGGNW